MSNPPTIKTNAMPEQVLSTMPPGSKGPMDAGIKMQQQQTAEHMALIGETKTGGSKNKRKIRGGATTPVATVPPLSSGAVNPGATQANYTDLTNLALKQQTDSTFDNARTPGDTAALQAQQQALYSGTGGSKKRMTKRGGSWPVWGCLSGGKQSRKSRKGRGRGKVGGKVRKSRKSRKSRKTKSHRM